ncbi:putative replication initiator protein [Mycobacterium intracellulare]|nr:putative replication initiator protein [Mycobacterium intracellulare]
MDGPPPLGVVGSPVTAPDRQPVWSSPITATELTALIRQAAGRVRIDVPTGDNHPNQGVRTLRFGAQIDAQALTPETTTAATDSETARTTATASSRLSPRRVAAYLAKYVTKSLHDFGITARRLSTEAIGELDVSEHVRAILTVIAELAEHGNAAVAGIGRWLHTLGYRGHITTKSRHYSTTMGALRTARATWTASTQRTTQRS